MPWARSRCLRDDQGRGQCYSRLKELVRGKFDPPIFDDSLIPPSKIVKPMHPLNVATPAALLRDPSAWFFSFLPGLSAVGQPKFDGC